MPRYRILQTFPARHETFEQGAITDFAQWRANDALFQYSNLPQGGLEAAKAAHEKARLEDITSLIQRGMVEDLDKDELGPVEKDVVTPAMIADAQRLLEIDWKLRTIGEQKPKGPQKLDDVLASKDVVVRLVLDPGIPPVFGQIIQASGEAFGVQVPFEKDVRWYAQSALDIPNRTFTGAGDREAPRKSAPMQRERAPKSEPASDQPS